MPDSDRADLFIRLIGIHERRLAAYVLTFVPRWADADDILQDTKLGLWRSFDTFQEGTDFGAWARRSAYNRVLDFRRRKAREGERLVFSDDCVSRFAAVADVTYDQREDQSRKLSSCLQKLAEEHREILTLRYRDSMTVEDISAKVERSVAATYRLLSRIRIKLRDCVHGPYGTSQQFGEPLL